MDGSYSTTKIRGELFRPVSLEEAQERFVPLIYSMITRQVMLFPINSCVGLYSILVKSRNGQSWVLRSEDYEKCLNVVKKFNYPIPFPFNLELTYAQILSYITVEFSV